MLVVAVMSGSAGAQGVPTPGGLAGETEENCSKVVDFQLVHAEILNDGCFEKSGGTYTTSATTDGVMLNGIEVPTAGRVKFTLVEPTTAAPGGTISADVPIVVTLAGLSVKLGQLHVSKQKLPKGTNGQTGVVAKIEVPEKAKLLGFRLTGSASLSIGKDAQGVGFTRFGLVLRAPSILQSTVPVANNVKATNAKGARAAAVRDDGSAARAAAKAPKAKPKPAGAAGKEKDKKQDTGVTAAVAVDVFPTNDVRLNQLKFEILTAYIGPVGIDKLCLSYSASTEKCTPPRGDFSDSLKTCIAAPTGGPQWDGALAVKVPGDFTFGMFGGVANGSFSYGGVNLSGLKVPIAPGFFIDSAALALCVNKPLTISGNVGIVFGPKFKGTSALDAIAALTYVSGTDAAPASVMLDGKLNVFGLEGFKAKLKLSFDGSVSIEANSGVTLSQSPKFGVTVDAKGWYDRPTSTFDFFGHGEICLAACFSGEVAVSSIGIAGCIHVGFRQVGIDSGGGYRWATAERSSKLEIMKTSCGVGGYRLAKPRAVHSQRADGSDPALAITLLRAPGTAVRVTGDGAPPNIELTGPDGRVITADKPADLERDDHLTLQNTEDNTTSITIIDAAPGTWTIRALPGSAPIAEVTQAEVHPYAAAMGKVTGKGRDRVLEYSYQHEPNQTIEFFERGEGYEREIGLAAGKPCDPANAPPPTGSVPEPLVTCGTIPFHSADGPGGTRKIVGVVMNEGLPSEIIRVATYTAPEEPPLAAPADVTIERRGNTVSVSWLSVAGADGYEIALHLSDGEILAETATANAREVTFPEDIAVGDDIGATVAAVDEEGFSGHSLTADLAGKPGALAIPLPEPPSP